MKNERVILFGGSFDPIHNGHLGMAEFTRGRLDAGQVIFIPAKRSPLKPHAPAADDAARLEMIRLAIEGRAGFEVSDFELRRRPPSYTYDTVAHFRKTFGRDTRLYWLVGLDAARELHRWHRVRELADLCHLTLIRRGGIEGPDWERIENALGPDRAARLRADMIETPLIEVSSTEIRRKCARGEDIRSLVPPAVAGYIQSRGLYKEERK